MPCYDSKALIERNKTIIMRNKRKCIWWILLLLPIGMTAQVNNNDLFYATHTGNPEIQADGLFKFFAQSEQYWRIGQTEQSILVLDNAIAQNPFFAEAYLKRSRFLQLMGRTTEARADLRTAQQLNPYIGQFFQPDDRKDRIEILDFDRDRYTNLDQENSNEEVEDFLRQSIDKKLEGDVDGALEDLEAVFENVLDPAPELYDLKGNLHLLLDDFPNAIYYYSQAIELDPNAANYYFNRGIARLFTYNRSAACADLETSKLLGNERSEEKLKYFCYQ